MIKMNHNNIEDPHYIQKYGILTEYIKPNASIFAKLQPFLFILKRFIVCFIIVFLDPYQEF